MFDRLEERYGGDLNRFLAEKVEVRGRRCQPARTGLDDESRRRLAGVIDLVVNSSGLTDFNPDLRDALTSNVEPAAHLVDFLRASDHAALLHLSTCYVVGGRDGRVAEDLKPNYTPADVEDFNAEREWPALQELVRKVEERAQSPELEAALRRQALGRLRATHRPPGRELDELIRKNRLRWIRNRLSRAGTRRARRLGWPNTYTFTKSMAESLLATRGAGLPIAVVRPSIVETSITQPFRGWNEGINTSAPLSYLLGTYFRQLPSNERKCLDVIPVDMVCRGMTLIAAALVERRHKPLYQLATSANNPCNMGRSIELTALAHRKHYRAQQGLEHWVRMRFDTIPVSKQRYRNLSVPAQKFVVQGHQPGGIGVAIQAPAAGQSGTRSGARRKTDRALRAFYSAQRTGLRVRQRAIALGACCRQTSASNSATNRALIDWWDYWINIHIPALRKWCYPLIEGHAVESAAAPRISPARSAGRPRRGSTPPAPEPHGHLPDRRNRLHRVVSGGRPARTARRIAEPSGSRGGPRGGASAACGNRCNCISTFPTFREHLSARIRIFRGDLTSPRFGLDDDEYGLLAASTDSVLHCAASLNRKSEKSCLNVNLRGTLEVVQLARRAHDAHGLRRFSEVSTVAVAGHRSNELVTEDSAIDWERSDYDPYARTKKFCEHMVRELLPDVPRTVFRPSIVLGDSRRPETTQFDMVRAFVFLARSAGAAVSAG